MSTLPSSARSPRFAPQRSSQVPRSVARGTFPVLILLLGLAFPSSAVADVHTVLPDGSGDYPDIQAAVDAAAAGDIIELGDGTFTGNGNRDVLIVGKSIWIRSASGQAESCMIDCEGEFSFPHRGFGLVDAPEADLRLIDISVVYVDIRALSWPDCNGGGAVCAALDGRPTLVSCACTLRHNQAGHGAGAYAFDSSDLSLSGCTLYANEAWNQAGGIYGYTYCNIALEQCIIAFSPDGQAVFAYDHTHPVSSCCDSFGNAGGDWTGEIADQLGEAGNISADPLFCRPEMNDLSLMDISPCAPFSAQSGVRADRRTAHGVFRDPRAANHLGRHPGAVPPGSLPGVTMRKGP